MVFVRFKIKEAAGREEVRKRKDVALRSIRRMICSTDEGGWRADGVRLGQVRELENGAIASPRRTGWPGGDASGVKRDVEAELARANALAEAAAAAAAAARDIRVIRRRRESPTHFFNDSAVQHVR